jgi:hypothetical protein
MTNSHVGSDYSSTKFESNQQRHKDIMETNVLLHSLIFCAVIAIHSPDLQARGVEKWPPFPGHMMPR